MIISLQHFDFMAHLEYVVELTHVHNALALTNLTLHDRKLSPPPSTTHLWRDDRRIVLLVLRSGCRRHRARLFPLLPAARAHVVCIVGGERSDRSPLGWSSVLSAVQL